MKKVSTAATVGNWSVEEEIPVKQKILIVRLKKVDLFTYVLLEYRVQKGGNINVN